MYVTDFDLNARDIAFEVNLGGDRFDRDDVAALLDGVTPEQLTAFKRRVYYHSVDFAPDRGYSDERFLLKAVDSICSAVRTGDGLKGFPDMYALPCDRNKWFRRDDGRYFMCRKATRWANWTPEQLQRLGKDPVPLKDIVTEKVSDLMKAYGVGSSYDRSVRELQLLSYSQVVPGYEMTVRQGVSDLSDIQFRMISPDRTQNFRIGSCSDTELERLMRHLDEEADWRIAEGRAAHVQGSSPAVQPSAESVSTAVIPLDSECVLVTPPGEEEVALVRFMATSVFETPDGTVMVSGKRIAGQQDLSSTPEENHPLTAFSDKSLDTICKATGRQMRMLFDKIQKPLALKGPSLKV